MDIGPVSAGCDAFGTRPDGRLVTRYSFRNRAGLALSILDHGAVVQQLWVPDAHGRNSNVVLGFRDLKGYLAAQDHFYGAVVGRFANRIERGRFVLDGVAHRLMPNEGPHTLHGGPDGFDRRLWDVLDVSDDGIVLRLVSPNGDQGFPGRLVVSVRYQLDHDQVHVDYRAEADTTTVVNLTSHAHFNLAGEGSGSVEHHLLQVDADHYTPVRPDLIPTGAIEEVAGTPLDFRTPCPLRDRIHVPHAQVHGVDHNFVLNRRPGHPAAVLADPGSGRVLWVHTDQPGLQVYTGNFFDGTHVGTSGSPYRQSDGVALESQHFPDSPNQPHFPSTVLRPGEVFASRTTWRFPTSALSSVSAGEP